LRRERIQFAAFVHDFGDVIVVVTQPQFQENSLRLAEKFDEFVERVEAVAAEDGEADFSRNRAGPRKLTGKRLLAQRRKQEQLLKITRLPGERFEMPPKLQVVVQNQGFELVAVHVRLGDYL
jgi:hypothetical protein